MDVNGEAKATAIERPRLNLPRGRRPGGVFSARTIRAYSMVVALVALWIILTVVTDGVFLAPRTCRT